MRRGEIGHHHHIAGPYLAGDVYADDSTDPNMGDGCRPVCRNSALATIALTAVNTSAQASVSFGL